MQLSPDNYPKIMDLKKEFVIALKKLRDTTEYLTIYHQVEKHLSPYHLLLGYYYLLENLTLPDGIQTHPYDQLTEIDFSVLPEKGDDRIDQAYSNLVVLFKLNLELILGINIDQSNQLTPEDEQKLEFYYFLFSLAQKYARFLSYDQQDNLIFESLLDLASTITSTLGESPEIDNLLKALEDFENIGNMSKL